MHSLNLPTYKFNIKNTKNKLAIFDIIRKKYVFLTPEEWVRQHIVHYLINEKNYPTSLIGIEKKLTVNNLIKRTDIVVFNSKGKIHLIVECKAPSVKISQSTFDQIARYNLKLNATYLMVTNGLSHFYCQVDLKEESYLFLKDLPNFNSDE